MDSTTPGTVVRSVADWLRSSALGFGRAAARLTPYVVLLLASGLVGLLVAEFMVRMVAPQQLILIQPDLWQPVDTVGWSHQPNVAVRINTGEGPVSVYTDREGFRVGEAGRREAATQVLLIGDSFMEALQVEHEQTVAHILEEELTQRLGSTVAVRNAGVSGWGPNHYLARVRQLVVPNRFAMVVVALYVGNDAISRRVDAVPPRAHAERKRFRFPRRVSWREFVDAGLAPINDALEVRSHLFILLKNRFGTLRMRMGLTATTLPLEYRVSEAESPRWRVTAEVARDIALEAQEKGASTVFVLIPSSFQVHEQDFQDYLRGFDIDSSTVDLDQPTRRLLDELTAVGLCVVDPLEEFRRVARAGTRLHGTVDAHLNPAGHALLADILAPLIVPFLARTNGRAGSESAAIARRVLCDSNQRAHSRALASHRRRNGAIASASVFPMISLATGSTW